jgi:hypothetical protein
VRKANIQTKMASVRVTGYTPVYRGRGKRRELVSVMERTEAMKKPVLLMDDKEVTIKVEKVGRGHVRPRPRLLVDDVEVKIGVKRVERKKGPRSPLTKTWGKHVGGQFDVLAEEDDVMVVKGGLRPKKEVKGAWAKSLKESASSKHGSLDAWASKDVKSYDEVLSDEKKTLEEELAALKATTAKTKKVVVDAHREKRKVEFEAQKARVQEAEECGDWGDMVMEMEALAALEAEMSAV